MPPSPDLKFPAPKAVQPQERISDVKDLLQQIAGTEALGSVDTEAQPIGSNGPVRLVPNEARKTKAPKSAVPEVPATISAGDNSNVLIKASKLTARLPAALHRRLRVHSKVEEKSIEDLVIEILDANVPSYLKENG